MKATLAPCLAALALCCASSKGAQGDPESNALARAQADNARLRQEVNDAQHDADAAFNEASAAEARVGFNGCAALASPAIGTPAAGNYGRLSLRHGTAFSSPAFSAGRPAGALRLFPARCEAHR